MRHQLIILTACLTLVASHGSAATLEVPAQYQTIAGAIAAAEEGDTVRVAPGTYVENIDFQGKDILLTSHYQDGGDWNLVETTIIDGSQPADAGAGSTVVFQSHEGPDAILQGFTITGGSGTEWVDQQFPTYTWRGGGGIFVFRASPTIRFNIVRDNEVENPGDVDGAQAGGILCFSGNPLIHNTIITHNEAEYGGGLVVDYSAARVRNVIISHNTGGYSYGGGGVWTIGAVANPILFENVVIAENSSPSRGGAIYVWTSEITVRNSIIWGNEQQVGGAIATVDGGIVTAEYCDVEGGFFGETNVDLDPIFVDLDRFELQAASPLIDMGDPGPDYLDREDQATPGQALLPALGGTRNDMGAYGGPGARAFDTPPAPPSQSWLMPAVIHAPGVSGTQWRTAFAVLNPGDEPAEIGLTLVLEESTVAASHTLGAKASVEWADVVLDLFGLGQSESTAGAVVLSSPASLLISSRVYNQADNGTFGQSMPALSETDCLGQGETGYLLQLKGNDSFRTNIGFANLGGSEAEVSLQLYDGAGASIGNGAVVTVEGSSWLQVNDVFDATSAGPQDLAYATVEVVSDSAIWSYASVVDAATGDATTVPVLVR